MALPPVLSAQSTAAGQVPSAHVRSYETRAQLESEARAAEQQNRTSAAWLLRSRLQNGDFQEGDRIIFTLDGPTAVVDTLQVRAGKLLSFPRMGDVSLVGVLRSELTDAVRSHLARYLQNPVIRVTPLLPIAVLGEVGDPGYYYVAADLVLRDVIMRAGGPAAQADLSKVVVRRAGTLIWDDKATRIALADGLSLDGLHLRAGDEIFVPRARRLDLAGIATVVSTVVAVTLVVIQLSQ